MDSLAGDLTAKRMDLEKAIGADWAQHDPSWAPSAASLVSRAFPNALDLSQDTPHRPSPHRHIERDFGPDLGMGL